MGVHRVGAGDPWHSLTRHSLRHKTEVPGTKFNIVPDTKTL